MAGQTADTKRPSHWKLVSSQTVITPEVLEHVFPGSGTTEDPYRVDWIANDPRNPLLMSTPVKWFITIIMAFGTLSVSFASTAFSGVIQDVQAGLGTSTEVAILSVSLFVLGFAIGPMTWAPLSELYGRQIIYAITFSMVTIFGGASIASQDAQTLLVLRFFAGAFGASAIVNSAGVIADMFTAKERGLAITVYCSAPFLGPTLGPLASGFLGSAAGWRWVDALTVIFTALLGIMGVVFVPETYAPHLLIQRAKKLTKMTGKVYKSKLEVEKGQRSPREVFRTAMVRPWVLLFMEPIVLLIAIYAAIIYGILYLTFAAFPIVFEQERGWSPGVTGLSFLGVMFGQIVSMFFYVWLDSRYKKVAARYGGFAPAEQRLPAALVGAPFVVAGLFWFAWTTYTWIHWVVPIVGSAFFGFGQVLLFIGMMNYTIDAYTVYAASALAANAILRALFGAAFPLFTTQMYRSLGSQWASSIPAFLSLACAPMPFLFYRYGRILRENCKYSAESQRILESMIAAQKAAAHQSPSKSPEANSDLEKEAAPSSRDSGTGDDPDN